MGSHPLTRRRSWGEHPLSIPANLSWFLLLIYTVALVPIAGLPISPWIVSIAWFGLNVGGSVYILRRRVVTLERSRSVDAQGRIRGTSLFRDGLRRLGRNQMATLSAGVLVIMVIACVGQRFLAELGRAQATASELGVGETGRSEPFLALHFDHTRQNSDESYSPPTVRHWFGTDALGRDVFARVAYGGTISFQVGVVATIVSLIVGVAWGAIAGYFGGRIDHYMMRIVDVLYGLPFMFLVILIMTLVLGVSTTAGKHRSDIATIAEFEARGDTAQIQAYLAEKEIAPDDLATIRTAVWLDDVIDPRIVMFLAIGLVFWLTMARITRGQVLSLREREFVVAARTVGAGSLRIIFLHIVPNLLGPVIIYTTLTIPTIMLAEAFLSFLGLGISEPQCSWGSLASDGLQELNVIKPYWWLVAYPALAMFLALFSLNFIGDGLRDALDPKMKR